MLLSDFLKDVKDSKYMLTKDAGEFKEELHPRGHPENAGQFGPGGGGGSLKSAPTKKPVMGSPTYRKEVMEIQAKQLSEIQAKKEEPVKEKTEAEKHKGAYERFLAQQAEEEKERYRQDPGLKAREEAQSAAWRAKAKAIAAKQEEADRKIANSPAVMAKIKENLPKYVYHIAHKDNIDSIKKNGLDPGKTQGGEEAGGVFFSGDPKRIERDMGEEYGWNPKDLVVIAIKSSDVDDFKYDAAWNNSAEEEPNEKKIIKKIEKWPSKKGNFAVFTEKKIKPEQFHSVVPFKGWKKIE